MKIDFVTLFPQMFSGFLSEGIVGRARESGLVATRCVNPRDFSDDKHRRVDDRPYGGGPGMVLQAEPLRAAVESVRARGARVVFLSPQGRRFDDAAARRLSREKH